MKALNYVVVVSVAALGGTIGLALWGYRSVATAALTAGALALMALGLRGLQPPWRYAYALCLALLPLAAWLHSAGFRTGAAVVVAGALSVFFYTLIGRGALYAAGAIASAISVDSLLRRLELAPEIALAVGIVCGGLVVFPVAQGYNRHGTLVGYIARLVGAGVLFALLMRLLHR